MRCRLFHVENSLTPKMPDGALNGGGDVSDHYRPAGL
jgi:hypothetical protein